MSALILLGERRVFTCLRQAILFGLLIAGGFAAIPTADGAWGTGCVEETVSLEIKFGDDREPLHFKGVVWKEGMTVFDVMQAAQEQDAEFKFKYRGKGETLFVTEIADQPNEGAGGKNWVFFVDDQLGKRSCGAVQVAAGQRVQWRFGKDRPND